ncbi:Time for coffee [Heracleum sosnowskyi]|uniref:Time for coffee n=1 Tax=Heracleum sosnowskyi TaxID=360622 RepID=A0AAD8IV11_9APIA|nr:Time for coffee [Heracleum sosnowskyi]
MDRISESRRAGASNGLSRRRHRTSSFRDSPDDEAEPGRLRERGVKKERERDRERERERSRSSKRRRADKLMNAGDESSEEEEEESVNDEDDDDDEVNFSRMLPPLPSNYNNNHHINNSVHSHVLNLNRKSLLPESGKVFKAAVWKASSHAVAGDEMIGVSVPRKARTASTKRSHDWIGGGGGGGGGGGEQMNHRQASSSPVRGGIVMSKEVVRDAAPLSPPSSSNVLLKKKIKPTGVKLRPQPRSSTTSKSSSSNNNNNNPEELEIEIAEVLYGLMTQSQAPSKNDSLSKNELNSNKSSSEAKSRASSPVSNSSSAAPVTAVAPKRKKARRLVDNNLVGSSSTRSNPTMKVEIDQTPRSEVCPPNLERNFGSAAENGESANSGESRDAVSTTKEEINSIKKDSPSVKLKGDPKVMIVTSMATSTNVIKEASANENKREENSKIDLMAPLPQLRSSPEKDRAVSFMSDRDRIVFDMEKMRETSKAKETVKVGISKEDTVIQSDEKGAKTIIEDVEFQKSLISKERNIDLHFDLEKPGMDTVNNPQNDHVVQAQVQYSKANPTFKEEQLRSAQSISLPLPMSVASWPGGIPPPNGYMTPLKGVVSVEGGTMPSAPVQPLFSQPRPKRCATHCHIARNIHYYQQLMKMNPFWPAPSGTASIFGAKPANVNVMPPTELHGNSSGRSLNSMQDKGHSLAIFPGNAVKENFAQPASIADAGHGKQQILLHQALPPIPPNNMMHGPAFIFPFNQQQAAVVAASGRPASAKSPTTTGSLPCSGAPNLTTVTASASAPANASAFGFNYPNMSANETQYLVLQNSTYPFPIPATGAPQNFRGHAQPMPMFNGSFYPSQIIHPLQLQQQQAPTSQQQQKIQQTHQNTSSGPTSSQKHLQSQQHRPQGIAINGGGTGNGVLQNFAAPKSRSSQHTQQDQNQNQHITPSQARQLESEVGGEDSPSTADSRGSRAPVNVYNQNFAMPIHPQNFALMSSSAASAGATGASGGNQNDKNQTLHQHPGFKSGAESLPSQAFAMSFGPMIGTTSASGIDLSSMSQNHAILQSLPEATRQSYHQVMQAAATAQAVQQKKNSRLPEDGKVCGAVSINVDEERKVITGKGPALSGGQSISFSRPDFADASESATPKDSASNSIARMLNLAPGSTHMPNGINLGGNSNSHRHAQLQHQQQLIQMHNQQQQQLAANVTARSKTPTSNGIASSEHLTSSSVASKFPNSISAFPPNFVQSSNNNSPTQSSQWKSSNRNHTSQVQSSLVSSTSSPKNHQQQQTRNLQNHTQISFGTNQKSSASQGQQHPNSSQSPSPPVAVGSPTHSSLSKGASSSPRTNTAPTNKTGPSTLSSQQPKNSTSVPSQKSSPAGGRNVPLVLGNPHSASQSATTKTQFQMQQLQQQQRHQQQFQQQLSKQTLQQALFFSNPYFQGQPPSSASSNTSAASGYNLQRRHSEQPQGSSPSTSGMLSMCPPATQCTTSTTDPAKAAAAAAAVAAAASNMKGGGGFSSQGIFHSAQFGVQSGNSHQLLPVGFSYGPAAVQVKPAEQKQPPEQKQPAA